MSAAHLHIVDPTIDALLARGAERDKAEPFTVGALIADLDGREDQTRQAFALARQILADLDGDGAPDKIDRMFDLFAEINEGVDVGLLELANRIEAARRHLEDARALATWDRAEDAPKCPGIDGDGCPVERPLARGARLCARCERDHASAKAAS